MSVHSSQRKKRRDHRMRFKYMGNNEKFLSRITKTLYYGKLPLTERLSLPVTEFAAELYSEVASGRRLERLSIEEAAKIGTNACVSPCSLVLAMLYLERLKTCNPAYVDKVAPSELFLISMMVASKFLHDDGEDNEVLNCEWAASAGLGLTDVNRLEKEFLAAIEWEVFIKDSTFWNKLRLLEKDVAMKEGKKRGWFSYTELENLLDCIDAFTLAQALITVSLVCLASYTVGVLTMVGSTMLVSHLPSLHLSTPSTAVYNSPVTDPLFRRENSFTHQSSDIITALRSCPTHNVSGSVYPPNNIDENWCETLHNLWFNENGMNDTNRFDEMSLNELLQGKPEENSYSSVTNYIQSITQHLSYFPTKMVVSY